VVGLCELTGPLHTMQGRYAQASDYKTITMPPDHGDGFVTMFRLSHGARQPAGSGPRGDGCGSWGIVRPLAHAGDGHRPHFVQEITNEKQVSNGEARRSAQRHQTGFSHVRPPLARVKRVTL